MALLVRSWNLFHGNSSPPGRRSFLREMVELAVLDEPDVLCLQEVPVWGLGRLGPWSGMCVFPAVARRGLPAARLAGWATRLHNGLLRSAITGQANAILVRLDHQAEDLGSAQVSDPGSERRVCQLVRIAGLSIVNTHLSSAGRGQRLELERALAFAESRIARPDDPLAIVGDLNLRAVELDGFSAPGPGIDHVLVRGASAGPLAVWPEARRLHNGVVLSDHPPVELRVG